MIESILANQDMDALYEAYANEESAAKDALITFEDKYPDGLKEDNLFIPKSYHPENQNHFLSFTIDWGKSLYTSFL